REPFFRDLGVQQQGAEQSPIRYSRHEIGRSKPERPQNIDARSQQLDVRAYPFVPDNVEVELEVLPKATSLRALIAKQLRDREPFDRLAHCAGTRTHHTR